MIPSDEAILAAAGKARWVQYPDAGAWATVIVGDGTACSIATWPHPFGLASAVHVHVAGDDGGDTVPTRVRVYGWAVTRQAGPRTEGEFAAVAYDPATLAKREMTERFRARDAPAGELEDIIRDPRWTYRELRQLADGSYVPPGADDADDAGDGDGAEGDEDRMPPLYKTTTVIWSPYPGDKMELSSLAGEAEDGSAYCSRYGSALVQDPRADPDWSDTEVFFEVS